MSESRSMLTAAVVAVFFTLGSCASFDGVFSAVTGETPGEAFAAEMQMRIIFPLVFYGYGGDPEHGYEESIGTVCRNSPNEFDEPRGVRIGAWR